MNALMNGEMIKSLNARMQDDRMMRSNFDNE